jgi:hypothetical protein
LRAPSSICQVPARPLRTFGATGLPENTFLRSLRVRQSRTAPCPHSGLLAAIICELRSRSSFEFRRLETFLSCRRANDRCASECKMKTVSQPSAEAEFGEHPEPGEFPESRPSVSRRHGSGSRSGESRCGAFITPGHGLTGGSRGTLI